MRSPSKTKPGCDLLAHRKRILLVVACVGLVAGAAGCGKQAAAELTRQNASTILGAELSKPHIERLAFTKDGLQQAISDGVVYEDPKVTVFGAGYNFTPAGVGVFGGLVKADAEFNLDYETMAATGIHRYSFPLTRPIAESIEEVTGIAVSSDNTIRQVEYRTKYIIPPTARAIDKYIFIGQTSKATFKLYDDGWRLVQQ